MKITSLLKVFAFSCFKPRRPTHLVGGAGNGNRYQGIRYRNWLYTRTSTRCSAALLTFYGSNRSGTDNWLLMCKIKMPCEWWQLRTYSGGVLIFIGISVPGADPGSEALLSSTYTTTVYPGWASAVLLCRKIKGFLVDFRRNLKNMVFVS